MRNIRRRDDAHLEPVLEGPQLLELLGPLEASRGRAASWKSASRGSRRVPTWTKVSAFVGTAVAVEGDGGAREVERVAALRSMTTLAV